MTTTHGTVTNIQHFTIHDGPGIRTEVFLKGCPLHCRWCSNPETIQARPEIGVYSSRCIGIDKCGACLASCPVCDKGVFLRHGQRITGIDRDICTGCMKCAEACPADALTSWGQLMSVDEVMVEIRADSPFYERSGGGVTLSGGEALAQWRFAREILRQCHDEKIHTCLETALHCGSNILEELYPFADLIISDIKHMDAGKHREYTGVGNERVLRNLEITVAMDKPLIVRVPVIPGHNDDEANIRATTKFIVERLNNKVLQVQLLPYRPLGVEKYTSIGKPYLMAPQSPADLGRRDAQLCLLVELMRSYGVPAVAGANHAM
jgi:pyruvate formate lyase activating enzyme